MPEGVEVKLYVENINKKFKNKKITDIKFISGRYIRHSLPENYKKFIKDLPLKIRRVECKGKFIWIEFIKSDWIIFITLGLTGRLLFDKDKNTRCIFKTDKKSFYFNDILNYGTISFTNDYNVLQKKLDKLGVDVLSKKFTYNNFYNAIKKQKSNKIIANVLSEQNIISGIGNYLRSDILYLSEISPFRELKDLTDNDIKTLYKNTKKIVKRSYKCQLKRGIKCINGSKMANCNDKFYVYKRKVTAKGEKVNHDKIGKERYIYWVKYVQK